MWVFVERGDLFDENGQVKPVAKELNRLINEWHTHVRGRLKESGEVLQGFRGTYKLRRA